MMGSMWGEWKAWLTGSIRVWVPWAAQWAAVARTGVSSPEMTVAAGPLMAAMAVPGGSVAVMSCAGAAMAIMVPPGGRAAMSWARVVTRVQASGRDKIPAAWAAVISPMEWPVRRSGCRPRLVSRV